MLKFTLVITKPGDLKITQPNFFRFTFSLHLHVGNLRRNVKGLVSMQLLIPLEASTRTYLQT